MSRAAARRSGFRRTGGRVIIAFEPDQAGRYTDMFSIDSDAGKGNASLVLNLKGLATGKPSFSSVSISGAVTASQAPVANATVNLYAAGEERDGNETDLISSTVTDSQGRLRFPRVYCANSNAQVYAVAIGGTSTGCAELSSAFNLRLPRSRRRFGSIQAPAGCAQHAVLARLDLRIVN